MQDAGHTGYYLRVLVPGGSRLVAATVQPIPAEWLLSGVADDGAARLSAGEAGAGVLSSFFVLPQQAERQTVFRYRLPAAVLARDAQGWHYHLALQKQPGTDGLPVRVRVRPPEGATLISATAPATKEVDGTLSFNLVLDQDRQLDVTFRMPQSAVSSP